MVISADLCSETSHMTLSYSVFEDVTEVLEICPGLKTLGLFLPDIRHYGQIWDTLTNGIMSNLDDFHIKSPLADFDGSAFSFHNRKKKGKIYKIIILVWTTNLEQRE